LRRLLACLVVVALVSTGAALAGRGDPRKQLTRADQARAKAMLLRKSDLPAGFRAQTSSNESDLYCEALDESDLTLTGDAVSEFVQPPTAVFSQAQVYESLADANASWRRGTSSAGLRCLTTVLRAELEKSGVTEVRFGRLAFPRLAQRSVAYRLTGRVQGIPIFLDVVVMQQSRAHAAVYMTSPFGPFARSQQLRLARLVEGRMATVMR
jgi:hypothetical protein